MRKLLLALIFVLAACLPSQAAFAVTNTRTDTPHAGVASVTLTYPGAVTVGSTLVAVGFTFNTSHATPAISDSVNGAWTVNAYANSPAAVQQEVWIATFVNTASGTPVVTNDPAGASADIGGWMIAEVTAGGVVDVSPTGTAATNNSPSLSSGGFAQASEAVFAVMTGDYGGTPSVTTLTATGAPWTDALNNKDQTVQFGDIEYRTVSSTGAVTASWTVVPSTTPNPGNAVMAVVSVKDTSGGAPACAPTLMLLGVGRCG